MSSNNSSILIDASSSIQCFVLTIFRQWQQVKSINISFATVNYLVIFLDSYRCAVEALSSIHADIRVSLLDDLTDKISKSDIDVSFAI